jgi:DNA-directed RNA polymerase subunit RPC12/RpoP
MPTMPQVHPSQKFKIEKLTNGGITFLALHGVLDESFEGQKVAESVRTKKLIVSLREVRRFASWGMAEWMNFLRGTAKYDVYLVECSTYAVNQMNLVTGLLGHGKLVSFYSPYRCGSCGEEFETLMLVPLDRAAIRDLADSEKVCATCGGRARMDKYPATMCAAISERSVFDMDDEVVTFLRTRLKYDLVPDVTRFRAHRRVTKGNVYLRLSGNLATLPAEALARASEGTTIVDLAAVVFDPEDLAPWRDYVHAAMPGVTSLQLLDCPPGFLERGVRPEDLSARLKVRTFALGYVCPGCNTTANALVDVAKNLEQLTEGAVPTARCPSCQSVLLATLADASLLRRLPAREHDAALDAFLVKARREPDGKLEDCLVAAPVKSARAAGGVSRGVYIASALTALLIAGLAVALVFWKQHDEPAPIARTSAPAATPPATPGFQRPEWIISDVPSSAFCQDMINRLVCVGVSSYRRDRAAAVAEASDAALEELVNSVGLKISDAFFRDSVLPGYSDARGKTLAALQAVDTDRTSAAYAAADEVVRKARRRVVEILQGSGGAAVPAQRSDWYWEEYAAEKGAGTEFLVFVRYDVALDAAKSLVEKYSAATPVAGSTAVTAFPGLAWQSDDFTGGAMLVKVARPLASLAPAQIVMAVADQRVIDAAALARRIDEWSRATGSLKLTVKAGTAAAQVVELKR